MALDVTLHIKPPRALFLPFMMGHHFGVPFHSSLQKRIVMKLLSLVSQIEDPRDIPTFEMSWAQARREGKALTQE